MTNSSANSARMRGSIFRLQLAGLLKPRSTTQPESPAGLAHFVWSKLGHPRAHRAKINADQMAGSVKVSLEAASGLTITVSPRISDATGKTGRPPLNHERSADVAQASQPAGSRGD